MPSREDLGSSQPGIIFFSTRTELNRCRGDGTISTAITRLVALGKKKERKGPRAMIMYAFIYNMYVCTYVTYAQKKNNAPPEKQETRKVPRNSPDENAAAEKTRATRVQYIDKQE